MLTYHHTEYFSIAELPFITNGAGDGSQATIIDCTSLSASQGRSKSIRIQSADSDDRNYIFNLWFGSTRTEVEQAILTGTPAQTINFSSSFDMTFPIETEYFAIDYDAALSNTSMQSSSFVMSITVV
jgi:hypothetical protein